MSFLLICPHITAVFRVFFLPTLSAIFFLSLIQNFAMIFCYFFLQIRKPNVLIPSQEDDIQCLLYFEIGHNVACFHSQRSLTTLFVNGWLKNFYFLTYLLVLKKYYYMVKAWQTLPWVIQKLVYLRLRVLLLTTSAQYPYVEHSWGQIWFTRLRDWFIAWLQSDDCVVLLGNFNN